DGVMAWDLHNEPDQYATWNDNRHPEVFIAWMDRMASEIRRLDSHHLITVGVSQFSNLFVADASGAPALGQPEKGRTVADISDFLSFHSYNAGNMDWQLTYIKGVGCRVSGAGGSGSDLDPTPDPRHPTSRR